MNCRHCTVRKANRSRGMCWTCYYTPGVRDLYPPSSKYARRGVGLDGRKRGRSKPTDARPGSKSKLRALIRRAASGKPLFLAADRQFPIADPRDEGRIGGSHNGAVPQRGKRKL